MKNIILTALLLSCFKLSLHGAVHGLYKVEVTNNQSTTAEKKQEINQELHQIGQKALQKMQALLLKHQAFLTKEKPAMLTVTAYFVDTEKKPE